MKRALLEILSGAALAAVLAAPVCRADDWPQFRGPASNSVAPVGEFPERWAAEGMTAWKVELPGKGPSSPIVVGDRVIVTASSGTDQDRLHVLCFAVDDGRLVWERQFWATGRTLTHPTSANAAPTPASDGRSIVAFFSSNDLVALDLDGNLLWYRGLAVDEPKTGNDVGMASSPLVVAGTAIVQSESQSNAFVAGIDLADGATRWRLDRAKDASWASPALLPAAAGAEPSVLLQSPDQLTCIVPQTGAARWTYRGKCDAISSACGNSGEVWVPADGMTLLRPSSVSEPEIVWKTNQLGSGSASPLFAQGKLLVPGRGVLSAADAQTGQLLCKVRLEGSVWGTPVMAGKRVLAVSQEGTGQLLEFADDFRSGEVTVKIAFGETVQSSPAVSRGAVYVRGERHLWKLVSAPAAAP